MIELGEQTNNSLSEIFNRYIIEHRIDSDGDIAIEGPVKLYIRVDKNKGMLRFFSFMHIEKLEGVSNETFDEYLDFINSGSYTVKYSKLRPEEKKSPITCEYGIILDGFVDDSFLIKTLRRVEKEISNAKNLAINYDSLMTELRKNVQEATE